MADVDGSFLLGEAIDILYRSIEYRDGGIGLAAPALTKLIF